MRGITQRPPTTHALGVMSLVLATALACGGDAVGPAPVQVEGRYALERIGERTMPVLIFSSTMQRLYVWADTLTLAGGVATQVYAYRDSGGPTGVTEIRGAASTPYRVSRDTLFFATSSSRTDTAFVTRAGIRAPSANPSLNFCPTGHCDYFFRRLP